MKEIWGEYTPDKLLADLHLHTTWSDGRLTPFEVIDKAFEKNLKAIAITDHDQVNGAKEALLYCQDRGLDLEIVVGSEISTQFRRHLIGLYLDKNIPSGKSLEWTIQAIHDRNGLAIVPHPMYCFTASLTEEQIKKVISNPKPEIYFDGFEIFNAAVADNRLTRANQNACKFYKDHQDGLGAAVGGTDAHYGTVGRGLTVFQADLRESLLSRKTSVLTNGESEVIKPIDFLLQQYKGLLALPARDLRRLLLKC